MTIPTRQIDDKTLLVEMHRCLHGLSDDVVREIADAGELMRCSPGEYIHRANEIMTSVYLVIQGRVSVSLVDARGGVLLRRFYTSGSQFGGLAAALAEPSPIDCIAEDPTTLLRLDYETALDLTKRHAAFRMNLTRAMAESVKQLLLSDRRPVKPPLVAICHQSAETRVIGRKLFERLVGLGETPCVLTDLPDWEPVDGVRHRCVIEGDRVLSTEEVRSQVSEWLESHRVFADIDTSFDPIRTSNVLEISEQVLWCVTPRSHEASARRLGEFLAQAPGLREKITIVWLLDGETHAPRAAELRRLARRDLKISFREPGPNESRALVNGLQRLVHLVRGIKIGVALGGGAARGMAHLGVLKALERSGIAVDMISGTSAGAMTGTLYAAGIEMDYAAAQFARELRPSWIFRHVPSGEQWYLLYKYRRGQFDPMLRGYLGDMRLEELAVPVSTIALDLVSGAGVVRDSGDAVHGIVESINLPVLSPPINRAGQALIDGGLINNVPADVLVEKGCSFVIAVSVTAGFEREFAGNRPGTPTGKMKAASTIQTILRTQLVQSANLNAIGVQPADVVIEPDVTGFELTAFTRSEELAAIGEQATLESIPRIREGLARMDGELFASA